MAAARKVSPSTLQFLLSDTGGIPVGDLYLALICSLVADGEPGKVRDILTFALKQNQPAADIREALLLASAVVGPFRVQSALYQFAEAGRSLAKPSGGLGALMGDSGGDVDPVTQSDLTSGSAEEDAEAQKSGLRNFEALFQSDGKAARQFFSKYSARLGRRLEADLFGRGFGTTELNEKSQCVVILASLFPMNLEHALAKFVGAAKQHFNATQLWHLHDLLKRQFEDGAHLTAAENAFSKALGGKRKNGDDGQHDPFRWD